MGGTPNIPGQLGWEGPRGGVEPTSPPAPGGFAALNQQLYSPPDRQSFNVSARRRLLARPATVVVPLSSSNTGSAIVTIQDNLSQNDGLLFDYMAAVINTVDTSGHLTIVDAQIQIGNGSNLFLALGVPTPTTLIPRVGTSFLFSPVPLLTAKDLDEWSRSRGFGTIFQPGGTTNLTVELDVSMANNDGAAGHNFILTLWLAYRLVNGLTGA